MTLHCYSGKPISKKSGHVAFYRFVRPFKESGYNNRQFQPTSYFRNTRVEFSHVQSLPAHQRHKSLS